MQGPVVCDIASTQLTDEDKKRIAHPLVGMVILFTRNYESPGQLAALCRQIHAVKPSLLISVDHEGGRVQRFRDGFTQIPAMRSYGELWQSDPEAAARALSAAGFVMASELRACGVDLTFAPVLDLDWGKSEIIGERSFALDPRVVTRLARAVTQGMAMAGMANCGKHFPGHGWAEADSHKALPVDDRPAERIALADAKPYSWMGVGLTSVMTAHVKYPQIDPDVPASFSKKIVTDLLRREIGFTGFVFSDDLSMQGAKGEGGIVERAGKALAAGCDGVIVCNAPEETDVLLAGLRWQSSAAFAERAALLAPRGEAPDLEQLKKTALYQRARALMEQGLS